MTGRVRDDHAYHKRKLYFVYNSVLLIFTAVREAVRKAEEAARKAADESAKHGDNAAELRVAAIKAKLAAQYAIKQRLRATHKIQPIANTIRKWGHLSKHCIIIQSTLKLSRPMLINEGF